MLLYKSDVKAATSPILSQKTRLTLEPCSAIDHLIAAPKPVHLIKSEFIFPMSYQM